MTETPPITFLKSGSGDALEVWVGGLVLGSIIRRRDGSVVYNVDGVRTRWVTKGHGEVRSLAAGRRAVRRAWRAWWAQMAEPPGWGPHPADTGSLHRSVVVEP